MSKYKHWYRCVVVAMIRQYPRLKAASANRELSPQEVKIVGAVNQAIEAMSRHKYGEDALRMVQAVDFDRRYSLDAAAPPLHMSRGTAISRRNLFIDQVAQNMGF